MNVQKRNDVTIYNLSSGPTLPEWLGERARRNLSKRDEQIRRRIELIQDFQMPSSSTKVVQTSGDGRYIFVGGTYPPRIRCYDVHELSMKFERYLDADIVDIQLLSEDYGKLAILLDNRTIAFHAHYGKHDAVRIPKFGRAMGYEPTTCELLLAASGPQIYRLNLDEGRFSEPWTMEPSEVSACSITVCPSQPLASVGCDDGIVRFWDNRTPDSLLKPFLKLDVQSATSGYGFFDDTNPHLNPHEITSMAFDPSGLYMAAGTSGGLVALYDIRSSKPLHIKEHKHGSKIHTVRFHSGSGCVVSSDEKLVKLWKYKSTGDLINTSATSADRFGGSSGEGFSKDGNSIGAVVANVEGPSKFSNFLIAGDENDPTGNSSGLIICATDQPKLESYYVPKAGLAPKWCSFLENITEELEERDLKGEAGSSTDLLVKDGQEAVFENYKFVSREELEKLGVSDLIGTPMLRGYMHGFFMDINLYNRVRAVANPFEYEEYRKKKLRERLEAKRASRIAPKENKIKKSKAAVNPDLAERLQDKAESGDTKAGKLANRILSDDRFGSLFTNPDYEIDEEDEDFKLRNPSGVAATASAKKKKDDMDSDNDDDDDDDESDDGGSDGRNDTAGFRRVEASDDEGEGSEDDASSEYSNSDSDEDGIRGGKVRGESYEEMRALKKKKAEKKPTKKQPKKTVLYEAEDDEVIGGRSSNKALHAGLGKQVEGIEKMRKMKNMPLEKRFKLEEKEDENKPIRNMVVTKGGSKELTYIPKDKKKKKQEEEEASGDRGHKRQRRGIKDLKFKTPFKNKSCPSKFI